MSRAAAPAAALPRLRHLATGGWFARRNRGSAAFGFVNCTQDIAMVSSSALPMAAVAMLWRQQEAVAGLEGIAVHRAGAAMAMLVASRRFGQGGATPVEWTF